MDKNENQMEREKLLEKLDFTVSDLKDSIDSLISIVDDYVDEAHEKIIPLSRIKEIIRAVKIALNNQETDLEC